MNTGNQEKAPTLQDRLQHLIDIREQVAKEPETAAKNLVIALLNAAHDRLKDHIRDVPAPKSEAAPASAPSAPPK